MLGVARYHFRTDLDPENSEYLPRPISIRYLDSFFFFFFISVEFLYFFCVTHNLLNIDNFIKEKQQMNAYIIIIYDKNTIINC